MKSDDSMRVGAKFDIIRKMIGTDSNTVEKSITPALNKGLLSHLHLICDSLP